MHGGGAGGGLAVGKDDSKDPWEVCTITTGGLYCQYSEVLDNAWWRCWRWPDGGQG